MESIIPTFIATTISQLYCMKENIPFIRDGTKTIPKKIMINLRNMTIGIFLHSVLTTQFITFSTNMNPYEEIVRMGLYSLEIEFFLYWFHRFMHLNPWLYKNVHKEHHLEVVPSPADAYILSMGESIILLSTYLLPLILGFDLTKRGVTVVQSTHLIMSILVHGGLKNVNHHMEHHAYFNVNYGGVYPFWDDMFNTRYIHTNNTKSIKVKQGEKSKNGHKIKLLKTQEKFSHGKKNPVKPIRYLKTKNLCIQYL